MKKLTALFSGLLMVALFSCDPASQYPISYKINGSTWYSSSAPAYYASNALSVNAISTLQNQSLTVLYFKQCIPGTFSLDHNNNEFWYGDTVTGYYAQTNNPATLIITEFNTTDKRIVGEFYGQLYNAAKNDSIIITDGKFDLHFQD
jgi:hypothetical protein